MTGFDSKRQAALDKLFEVENELGLHYDERTPMTKDDALTLEALKYAASLGHSISMLQAISAPFTIKRDKALAQPEQEPHNFCPRCGKRAQGVLGQPQVHTCTPPLWGHT